MNVRAFMERYEKNFETKKELIKLRAEASANGLIKERS
jgi:hypothetical protein